MTDHRKCKKCELTKPLSDFYTHDRGGHRHTCKHCQRVRIADWQKSNPERRKALARASYRRLKENPEWWEARKASKRVGNGNTYAGRVRDAAYAAYGGPKCACCGETEPRFLTIDHIDNDGHIHRKKHRSATNIYGWLKARKYPPGFQVLCANCNFGKALNGGTCPHKSRQEGPETIAQASTLK